MDIYEPQEDSYLIAKYVEKMVPAGSSVLEIGCGSGILSEVALNKTSNVIGLDINKSAIALCKKKMPAAKFYESDLFEALKNKKSPKRKFDVIIFNPPYLPDSKDPENIKAYTTGGKHGYEIIDRFMSEANNYLDDKGIILIVFSSLTKKPKVDEIITKFLFEHETLEEMPLFMERLYCYKITKSDMLKKLNLLGVKQPVFFAKGRRGFAYTAKYKSKSCIVKITNPKMPGLETIAKEAMWLQKMNKLGIGPKLYYSDNEIVIMEYINGPRILDFIEKSKRNKKIIVSMLLKILDQLYLLDNKCLAKTELTLPLKHILIKKGIPVLIDFERTKYVVKPSNITQFLQFLSYVPLAACIKYDKTTLIELSKDYLKTRNIEKIKKYLKSASI
jgi:release factor glutamine methyltransferase